MRQDLEANYSHKYSTLILAAAHFQTLVFLYPDKTSLTGFLWLWVPQYVPNIHQLLLLTFGE